MLKLVRNRHVPQIPHFIFIKKQRELIQGPINNVN